MRNLWEINTASLSRFKRIIVQSLRLLCLAAGEFRQEHLTLRAMGLVYMTLLSIVPVLAVSFSVLKAFGVHYEIVEPFLLQFLAPLGPKGKEITFRIIEFVENMKVGVLGSVGLAILIYTVISVIQKIEKAFNSIWGIKRQRSIARRFSDYISVIIIGPVLVFSAIGLTASFMSNTFVQRVLSIEPMGTLFVSVGEVFPYIIVCAVFTFLYMFIPNIKVQFRSALTGGIFAGVLWEAAGWAFATFTVSSAKYAAIYSGFAILIMFMIWLYLSWLILLVGAQVAYHHQYPYFLSARKEVFQLSSRLRERLLVLIMYLIGHNYYYNKLPWTLPSIVKRLNIPVDPVRDALDLLERNSLVIDAGNDPPVYLPAKDMGRITLVEIINAVRVADPAALTAEKQLDIIPEINEVLEAVDASLKGALGERTLKEIVCSAGADPFTETAINFMKEEGMGQEKI